MATSALVLMSLLSNNNVMRNMYDMDYLKKQQQNRLNKKEQYANSACQVRQYKASLFSGKTHKMHNSLNGAYYFNYNIKKEYKR
jgi:hypothetical protein